VGGKKRGLISLEECSAKGLLKRNQLTVGVLEAKKGGGEMFLEFGREGKFLNEKKCNIPIKNQRKPKEEKNEKERN